MSVILNPSEWEINRLQQKISKARASLGHEKSFMYGAAEARELLSALSECALIYKRYHVVDRMVDELLKAYPEKSNG